MKAKHKNKKVIKNNLIISLPRVDIFSYFFFFAHTYSISEIFSRLPRQFYHLTHMLTGPHVMSVSRDVGSVQTKSSLISVRRAVQYCRYDFIFASKFLRLFFPFFSTSKCFYKNFLVVKTVIDENLVVFRKKKTRYSHG